MNEWTHKCSGTGHMLLIPAGELCDRCGMEPPDAVAPRRDVPNRCEPCSWHGKLCDGTCGVAVPDGSQR